MAIKYLWHYDVHRKFREELLYFQVAFWPTYKQEQILSRITDFFKREGIRSYFIYEIYGIYDILLRVWVPQRLQPSSEFKRNLEKELENLGCSKMIPFYVEGNPLHWMWWDQRLRKQLSPSETEIKQLPEEIVSALDNDKLDQHELENLENKHLLKKYDPKVNGIKFFIIIPNPSLVGPVSAEATESVARRLMNVIIGTKKIIEPSVYFGEGIAWFLVKGKTLPKDFEMLGHLIQKINQEGDSGRHIRTQTYFTTSCEYIEEEGVSLHRLDEYPSDVLDYINQEEDEYFEMKGSLLLNVKRYLEGKSGKEVFQDQNVLDGVLRSIVAFLNSHGGKILIGVLETEKFADVLENPNSLLSGLPVVANRIVLGINAELGGARTWDYFERQLKDYIQTHIKSSMGKSVSTLIKIQRLSYNDRILCLIEVPKGLIYFYLNDKFYVRRGNSTVLLEGIDQEGYKKTHPRV